MRFTIRDVLWLTALAAMAVAWLVDRSQLAELNRTLKDTSAQLRMERLRASELRGEVILEPDPNMQLRLLELPRARNE
jgi:hypothetical protein